MSTTYENTSLHQALWTSVFFARLCLGPLPRPDLISLLLLLSPVWIWVWAASRWLAQMGCAFKKRECLQWPGAGLKDTNQAQRDAYGQVAVGSGHHHEEGQLEVI